MKTLTQKDYIIYSLLIIIIGLCSGYLYSLKPKPKDPPYVNKYGLDGNYKQTDGKNTLHIRNDSVSVDENNFAIPIHNDGSEFFFGWSKDDSLTFVETGKDTLFSFIFHTRNLNIVTNTYVGFVTRIDSTHYDTSAMEITDNEEWRKL